MKRVEKVLFVCWQNVSRSQMAEAMYNKMTNSSAASSAGTGVELPGESLEERKKREGGTVSIAVMAEKGLDISSKVKTELTPEMLDEFDRTISFVDEERVPSWLLDHPKYVHWQVSDPGAKDIDKVNIASDEIETRLKQWLKDS